jgi:hypothetical protein
MDVSMTHRNISRLTGNEIVDGKLVPAKEAITEADFATRLGNDLEVEELDPWAKLADDLKEPDPYGAVEVPKAPWADIADDVTYPFWDTDTTLAMKQDMVDQGQSADDINDFFENMYVNDWDIDMYETEVAQWMKDQGGANALDPTYRLGARQQAEEGETLFVEPAAFFEWFQEVSEMPKGHVGRGEPQEDILQRLVKRRVELVADQQRATLAYVET